MNRSKRIIAPLLAVILLAASCTSSDAKKAANAAQDVAVSINILIETKRDLLAQGLITNATALQIDKALLDLNAADRLFAQGVDKWSKGQLNKAGLVALFAAVNTAVKKLNEQGALITNDKARAAINSVTATIAVSIAVIQGVLGIPAAEPPI